MARHPNAVAGASGGIGGVLVVLVLGWCGVDVSPEQAAAISTVGAFVVLKVGRNGIKGLARILWRGSS